MSPVAVLPLLALLACPVSDGAGAKNALSVRVAGHVELSQLEALASGEQAVVRAVVARFGPEWRARASWGVPAARIDAALEQWLKRDLAHLPGVASAGLASMETSVGPAYTQSFDVRLSGPDADELRRAGHVVVRRINRLFRRRYLGMGILCVFLLFAGVRLDRATNGWLTGRIRLGMVAAAVLGAIALFP